MYQDPIIGATLLHNCLSKHTLRQLFLLAIMNIAYLVINKMSFITFYLSVCNFWYVNTLVVLQR
jgi:hypothetical protein